MSVVEEALERTGRRQACNRRTWWIPKNGCLDLDLDLDHGLEVRWILPAMGFYKTQDNGFNYTSTSFSDVSPSKFT